MKKLLYRPVGLIAGAGAGLIAGFVFKKIWQLASGDDDAKDGKLPHQGWFEETVARAEALFGKLPAGE